MHGNAVRLNLLAAKLIPVLKEEGGYAPAPPLPITATLSSLQLQPQSQPRLAIGNNDPGFN
jgi:hypothetical protein